MKRWNHGVPLSLVTGCYRIFFDNFCISLQLWGSSESFSWRARQLLRLGLSSSSWAISLRTGHVGRTLHLIQYRRMVIEIWNRHEQTRSNAHTHTLKTSDCKTLVFFPRITHAHTSDIISSFTESQTMSNQNCERSVWFTDNFEYYPGRTPISRRFWKSVDTLMSIWKRCYPTCYSCLADQTLRIFAQSSALAALHSMRSMRSSDSSASLVQSLWDENCATPVESERVGRSARFVPEQRWSAHALLAHRQLASLWA